MSPTDFKSKRFTMVTYFRTNCKRNKKHSEELNVGAPITVHPGDGDGGIGVGGSFKRPRAVLLHRLASWQRDSLWATLSLSSDYSHNIIIIVMRQWYDECVLALSFQSFIDMRIDGPTGCYAGHGLCRLGFYKRLMCNFFQRLIPMRGYIYKMCYSYKRVKR